VVLTREQEVKLLMDRAEQSPGGPLVNVLAYKGDYVASTEELQLLEIAGARRIATVRKPGVAPPHSLR
jgi:hypothetical protein